MKKITKMSILISCIFFTACGIKNGDNQLNDGISIYNVNKDETKVVPELFSNNKKESADIIIPKIITELNKHINGSDYISLLPDNVEIDSFGIDKNVLNLELSKKYKKLSKTREALVRYGLIRTFTQIAPVDKVKISIGKEKKLDSKGNEIGGQAMDEFVQYDFFSKEAEKIESFSIFFPNEPGDKLVEKNVNVLVEPNISKGESIVKQLIYGSLDGQDPVLSNKSKLKNVIIDNDVCYITFSNLKLQDDIPKKTVLYSIVDSIIANLSVEKVQIISDNNDEPFGDKFPLYSFYQWNGDMISGESSVEKPKK